VFDFGSAFGFAAPNPGDRQETVSIGFEEAARGCTRHIQVRRRELCEGCDGRGVAAGGRVEPCAACSGRGRLRFSAGMLRLSLERACEHCAGRGTVPLGPACVDCGGRGIAERTRTLSIEIPPGIESGAKRTLPGQGDRAEAGAEPGDLTLVIEVSPHPVFERDGSDVVSSVEVDFCRAALGGSIDTETLDGPVAVQVPPGTQAESLLRLRRKGLASRRGRGDHLLRVKLRVPTEFGPRARELIAELGSELETPEQVEEEGWLERLKKFLGS